MLKNHSNVNCFVLWALCCIITMVSASTQRWSLKNAMAPTEMA